MMIMTSRRKGGTDRRTEKGNNIDKEMIRPENTINYELTIVDVM